MFSIHFLEEFFQGSLGVCRTNKCLVYGKYRIKSKKYLIWFFFELSFVIWRETKFPFSNNGTTKCISIVCIGIRYTHTCIHNILGESLMTVQCAALCIEVPNISLILEYYMRENAFEFECERTPPPLFYHCTKYTTSVCVHCIAIVVVLWMLAVCCCVRGQTQNS